MLKYLCLLALVAVSPLAKVTNAAVVVNTFDDIALWTGTGANRAALVIDWADGRDALVWGYRFDSATGADMLRAVTEADPNLYAKVQDFGGTLGWFTHGMGYDRNSNGFGISTGTNFGPDGFVFSPSYSDASATDAADSYRETDAAFANSWAIWNGTGNAYPGAAGWATAQTGVSGRVLANNSWDGFQFNTLGFGNGIPPGSAVSAVPEPSGVCLLIAGVLGTSLRRRNRV
ncbi:MAG: hypothetical protein Aurels2KO_16510 [Aureliella sp.]